MAGRKPFRALSFCWLILITGAMTGAASIDSGRQIAPNPARWQLHRPRVEKSFGELSVLPAATGSCEVSQPPEALATPDPLVAVTGSSDRVAVSFIIGADGQVHAPVILESAGSLEDHNVLNALRSWRYRPAMCNAAPAESESRVEFSSR